MVGQQTPRYLEIAAALRRQIDLLSPNSLLPTEQQLAKRFGVSRVTVRGALDMLERGGLVSRLRGRGTIVSPPKITRRFSPLYSFERDLAKQGVAFETRVLSYEREATPSAFVREGLRLGPDSQVGCLSLVRLVDDRIVCHDRRHYPPEIAAKIQPQLVEQWDASEVLEGVVGAPIAEVDWESEIIASTPEVATALEISAGTLVLANSYRWRLGDSVPVEAGVIYYRIDRCKFRYEVRFHHAL